MIYLTPEQRYRQACQKARMIGQRQCRQMMAGERDDIECWGDLERQFIIDEIGKAFVAGMRAATSLPSAHRGEV
jgi:hypothetical protein